MLSQLAQWERKFSFISISALTARAQRSPPGPCVPPALPRPHWGSLAPPGPGAHPAKTLCEPFRNPHLRNPHKNPGQKPPANPATGALPSPTCSLLSAGSHYISQPFLNAFFFFLSPSSLFLTAVEHIEPSRGNQSWELARV